MFSWGVQLRLIKLFISCFLTFLIFFSFLSFFFPFLFLAPLIVSTIPITSSSLLLSSYPSDFNDYWILCLSTYFRSFFSVVLFSLLSSLFPWHPSSLAIFQCTIILSHGLTQGPPLWRVTQLLKSGTTTTILLHQLSQPSVQ